MAPRVFETGLAMVLAAALLTGASAQSNSCTSTLIGLAPCLSYITGNSSSPSSSCCSQLQTVVTQQPQCLCLVLNGGGSTFGLNINQTQALALPGACNVKTPPLSQCNSAGSPTASPTVPTTSPATPTTPRNPSTPSVPTVSSGGGGSKTTPGVDASHGTSMKISFSLVFFLVFLASHGSTVALITIF